MTPPKWEYFAILRIIESYATGTGDLAKHTYVRWVAQTLPYHHSPVYV